MSRRRRFTAIVLVALASLMAYVALLAIWANRQVLDTENWTERSTRVLATPAVPDRVAAYLVDRLYAEVDVAAQNEAALPQRPPPPPRAPPPARRPACPTTPRGSRSCAPIRSAWPRICSSSSTRFRSSPSCCRWGCSAARS